jgi:hypothetical protein
MLCFGFVEGKVIGLHTVYIYFNVAFSSHEIVIMC